MVRHVVLICMLLINELNPFKATKSLQLATRMPQTTIFKEFVLEEEPISAYPERAELFVHGVAAKKQVATLLIKIIRSLAAPKAP